MKQAFTLVGVYGRDAIAEQIHKDIDEYCAKVYYEGPRSHLGASIIGHECDRYIWFAFRWMFFEQFSGRMQRLFDRGKKEEARLAEWLRGIGFEVKLINLDGMQFRVLFNEKHGGGSSDGITTLPQRYGTFLEPILLEFKTQKDKGFEKLQGSGFEKEKPRHFTQVSIYGRLLAIRYCLYIAINKQDDDLNVELVELDWDLADAELTKADYIIKSRVPPRRISETPTWYLCKWCPANSICHLNAPVQKNCRSCHYSTPVENAEWHCGYWNGIIPKDFIPQGCDAFVPLHQLR